MNLLGIDTSTAAVAACVLRADGEAFEYEPAAAPDLAHGRELLPAIAGCLERAALGFADLGAIAVGVGPGGFTGLRIGVATAHGIAAAHGAELRPVSSLAALASGIEGELLLPLLDARRGEIFGALFERDQQLWPAFAAPPEEVAARVSDAGLIPSAAGDGSVRFRDVLEAAGVRVAPAGSRAHSVRGLSVCRLGTAASPLPAAAVLPDYVREPDAKPPTP